MDNLTILFAVIFCGLVLVLKPTHALGVYFASLVWYPNYMTVSFGTIDISLSRFVVAVLLLRCLLDSRITSRPRSWCRLDSLVLLSMAAYTIPIFLTHPFGMAVENRAGFLMDTLLAYAVARLVITDYPKLLKIIKIVAVILVPLTVVGVVEAVTGIRPFRVFLERSAVFTHLSNYGMRYGFYRAFGPFSHSILFGCTFGLFIPLIYYLRHQSAHWRYYAIILSLFAMAGAMSSMSSGPYVLVMLVIVCLIMEHAKNWLKVVMVTLVVGLIMVDIISNRTFYHVIASYANPLGGSGWHRAKLIDLAISHFNEWWLVGYGPQDPGWGEVLGMAKTDITNEFVFAAVRYGIWGVGALCAVLVNAFIYMIRIHQKTLSRPIKSLSWAFGSVLVAVTVCWMSVSFFGQLMPLFYVMLGMLGSFYVFTERQHFYTNMPVKRKIKTLTAQYEQKHV